MMDSHRWTRTAVLAAALVAATPVAAQEAQGPPDGFLPPAPTRPTEQPAQGPDNGGIAPIATPQPRQPTPTPAPTITIPAQPAPERSAPLPAAARPQAGAAAPAAPRAAAPVATTQAAPLPLPSLPPVNPLPEPVAGLPIDDSPLSAPVAAKPSGAADWLPSWWPWALAALAALVVGVWWLRRSRSSAALVDGADDAPALPQPAAAPTPAPLARTAAPLAAPQPRPAPPAPVASPPPTRVSGRAKLVLTLKVDAIDIMADAARISFTLLLTNQGDRAATGGLVRIALQQANRRQAELLERFFDGAGGSVLAEDVEIAPGDVGTIQRHALLALDQVEPMLVAGYPSLIPVIGFDVTYHWDGEGEAFGQVASVFVLGSTAAADGRIAPVRLDLPPRRLATPSARATEMLRVL